MDALGWAGLGHAIISSEVAEEVEETMLTWCTLIEYVVGLLL